ncbi:4671_t:CDS:2 [Paraglomus brasilianum]|uniref:4671_t:CDS:1 n=1 Tax=Paraglomus brasilianum TaxID=144538 RepID=A0A9N9BJ98_9GLOM|nr:4671_t:CDS:2 [Paraglomus brasilianum]
MGKTGKPELTLSTHQDSSLVSENIDDEEATISPTSSTMSSASFLDPIETAAGLENIFDMFVYVDGRRFLKDKDSKCYLPCDEQEAYRTYKRHYLYRFIWKGNYSAPVLEELSFGARVLDVGCAEGTWLINMSSEYPLSTFVGVDIAPVFPEVTQKNVAFLQCNALDGLPFPNDTFDFVRQGFLIVSINWQEWKDKLIKELIRVTKTGGYIEVMDVDIKYYRNGGLSKYLTSFLTEHFEKIGINPIASRDVLKAFEDLNDVVTVSPIEEKIHPFGSWAGKLGEMSSEGHIEAFESLEALLCPALKATKEEYRQMLIDLAEEYNRCKTYSKTYRVLVRKNKDL